MATPNHPEIDPRDPKVVAYFKRLEKEYPKPLCYCICGKTFRSDCYTDYMTGGRYTKVPCPSCGSHSHVNRVSHDRELIRPLR